MAKDSFYFVKLPETPELRNIFNQRGLETTLAVSPKSAVGNILYKKVNPELNKESRKRTVAVATTSLQRKYGESYANFAERLDILIPTEFSRDGDYLDKSDGDYTLAQEVFVAQEVFDRLGIPPLDALKIARDYLRFNKNQ